MKKIIMIFRKIRLLQAPDLTLGHRIIGIAAIFGSFFIISHLVTIIVTCVVNGYDWGVNAWIMDILGFTAGIFFTIQCWLSSNRTIEQSRNNARLILIWAVITIISRILDILMLFGIVKFQEIYITPKGAILFSNIVSEIVFGFTFAVLAFIGSTLLIFLPQDLMAKKNKNTHNK